MKEHDIPSAFLELYRAGRLDFWGEPGAPEDREDRERLFEARRHVVLGLETIEFDRSIEEIVSYAGEECVRPGLVPFAGDGHGNAYCWYPPWQKGEEPPVVFYYHDEEDSELFAESFSECLCRCLLQHFARSEEETQDPLAAEKFWLSQRAILDPYLDPSQRQLLDEVAGHFTPEACAEADERIAAKLGARTLRGLPPTLEIDPSEFGLEAAHRHYDKAISYFRELIETEGRAEFSPQLEKALALRTAAAAALEAGGEPSGKPATRSRRETVVQRPTRTNTETSYVSWDDL